MNIIIIICIIGYILWSVIYDVSLDRYDNGWSLEIDTIIGGFEIKRESDG